MQKVGAVHLLNYLRTTVKNVCRLLSIGKSAAIRREQMMPIGARHLLAMV